MGRVKASKHSSTRQHDQHGRKSVGQGIRRRQHSQTGKLNRTSGAAKDAKHIPTVSNQQIRSRVPFTNVDQVLLVGEGDFSFALSLVKRNSLASVVATSYDDQATLASKYPDVQETLQVLQGFGQRSNTCHDPKLEQSDKKEEEEWNGFSHDEEDDHLKDNFEASPRSRIAILHGIDATSLSKRHRKSLSPYVPFTKIVFNFPHTGGLSTDVNRQVRANQELLVAFFNSAKLLLATTSSPAKDLPFSRDLDEEEVEDSDFEAQQYSNQQRVGRILVTLFEGEPYTLWNIRDLARHCGLQVVESFKFPWTAYPGYKHARTIGDITTGKDRTNEGKRKGAWRGEERDARCYVLGLKDEILQEQSAKKRKKLNNSDDEDD